MTENGTQQGVIVCGLDGSSGSRRALQQAIRIAARGGGRVRVVAVYETPEMWAAWGYGPAVAIPVPDVDALRENELANARMMVDEVSQEMASELTLPEVTVEVQPGRAAEVLADLASGAEALVVGRRGRGKVASVMLGSVSLGCLVRASCPVIVVPEAVAE